MSFSDREQSPLLMRKLSNSSREHDEKLIVQLRRGMTRFGLRKYLYALGGIIIIYFAFRWIYREDRTKMAGYGYMGEIMTPAQTGPKLNTVRLEVYMESQCPDTSRFIHKQLTKAWAALGHTGRVDLTLIPFGKARCVEKGDDFTCNCQHGPVECELNQLMNCVIERIGFPDKIVPIIDCIQGKRGLDEAVRECIQPSKILDEKQMTECSTGPRGRRLLAMAGARTVALKPALNFVPWIMIDGERNSDALYDLTENLCRVMEPGPEECAIYENKN